MPYLAPSGELKTKPTQHSVAALRSIGISPDALILRCDRDVPEPLKNKIALMCDVDIDGVISTPDAPSIYDIPKVLHREELDAYVVRGSTCRSATSTGPQWDDLLRRVHEPQETVRIALVGKYIDLSDAYLSVAEALRAGGFRHRAKVEIRWVASDDCETDAGAAAALDDVHGVLIPGGFGIRGIEGKIGAIQLRAQARHAGARSVPRPAVHRHRGGPLGRHRRGQLRGVRSRHPGSGDLDDGRPAGHRRGRGRPRRHHAPRCLSRRAGTGIRLWRRPTEATEVSERHRHRYEVNNAYRDRIAESGLRFSGTSPDGHLVEFVEYDAEVHPFLVGTQAHPELKSRPTRPHPLFVAFVGAALDYKAAERLPVEIADSANGAERAENAERAQSPRRRG